MLRESEKRVKHTTYLTSFRGTPNATKRCVARWLTGWFIDGLIAEWGVNLGPVHEVLHLGVTRGYPTNWKVCHVVIVDHCFPPKENDIY